MDNLERFEVKLRTDVDLENQVYALCEKLPARSRSSVYKRQILAALAAAELMTESGEAADLQTALYYLAKRAGLSEVEISIYMPEFNFSSMQPIESKGIKNFDDATQNLSNFVGQSSAEFKGINHLQLSDPPALSVEQTSKGVSASVIDEPDNILHKKSGNKVPLENNSNVDKDNVASNKDGSSNDANENKDVAIDTLKLLGW